ncbi:MAG: peroxide stress protein YaaA [Flavobacteriales bacterium]|nr:peroxide stress protein YaaA [Flavobacteriales bacterium]
MLTLLSPAKKLNEENQLLDNCSSPIFVEDAEKLISSLRKYNPKKLSKLMGISPVLADLNVNRYAEWDINHTKNVNPAVLTFNGEVYAGLDAISFSKKEKIYAQDNLRILSGLYALLKPYDLIHPYRLEMGTKLKDGRKNNLYEFWGDKIVNEINDIVSNQKETLLVNLASNEYFKSINKKKLAATVITPVFKDFNNGTYKTVMVYAKKARGMMASYIIKNKIEKVENLKGFDASGYCFNTEVSTDTELVFYRG